MFYEFRQNNSGGSFVIDDDFGERVIVEADDSRDAFDFLMDNLGAEGHSSCYCCGSRWSNWLDDNDGYESVDDIRFYCGYFPSVELNIETCYGSFLSRIVIHYENGDKDIWTINGKGTPNTVERILK